MKFNMTIELEHKEVLEALTNYIKDKNLYNRDVPTLGMEARDVRGPRGLVVTWGEPDPEPEPVTITHKPTEPATTVS